MSIKQVNIQVNKINYYQDIEHNIKSKSNWKITSDASNTFSKIISSFAIIVSFASGYFNYSTLSFIAGSLGTVSSVSLQFSTYAMNESRERTQTVNKILEYIGINKIVDISIDNNTN